MERFALSRDYVVLGSKLNSPECIFQGTTAQHVCYRRGDRKHGRSPNRGLHSWVSERRGDLIATCFSAPNPHAAGQTPVRQPSKLHQGTITSGASHRLLSFSERRFRDTEALLRLEELSKQTVEILSLLTGCYAVYTV